MLILDDVEEKVLTLENEKVREAKLSYERLRPGPRCQIPFDKLFEEFNNPYLSLTEIAKQANASYPTIKHLLTTYFSEIFPKRISDTSEPRRLIRKELGLIDDGSPTYLFSQEAKKRKINFQRIYSKGGFLKRYGKINGELCYILARNLPRKYHKSTDRAYFHFSVHRKTVKNVKFIIFITKKNHKLSFFYFKKESLNLKYEPVHIYIPDLSIPPKIAPRKNRLREYLEHKDALSIIQPR